MNQYIARQDPVEAEQIPDPEGSYQAAAAFQDLLSRTGGEPLPDVVRGGAVSIKIGYEWRTAKPDDWIVWRGGRVSEVLSDEAFKVKYEAAA